MSGRRPLDADERALLDALVRELGPRLLAYVRRAYGAALDAEEIVAETFGRAAANISTVRRCEHPELYLFTIARNLCRDQFRRHAATSALATVQDRAADALPADEAIDEVERRRALLEAVTALPDAQREVVALRLAGTLKFEEIAALLDVPLGTVLSRMHAAVARLREKLGYVCEH